MLSRRKKRRQSGSPSSSIRLMLLIFGAILGGIGLVGTVISGGGVAFSIDRGLTPVETSAVYLNGNGEKESAEGRQADGGGDVGKESNREREGESLGISLTEETDQEGGNNPQESIIERDTTSVREETEFGHEKQEASDLNSPSDSQIELVDPPELSVEGDTTSAMEEIKNDRGEKEVSEPVPPSDSQAVVEPIESSTSGNVPSRGGESSQVPVQAESLDFSAFWRAPADGLVPVRYDEAAFPEDLERFLLFDGMYGQLNNQICAYVNALLLGKAMNATVVIPPGEIGFESFEGIYRTRVYDGKKAKKEFYIIGDYFDLSFLQKHQRVIRMSDFLGNSELVEEAKARNLIATPTNLRRMAEFEAYETLRVTQRSNEEEKALTNVVPGTDLCDKLVNVYSNALMDSKVNGRFITLACGYMDCHRLNCTDKFPYWLSLRRYLQPLEPMRRTVEEYRQSLGKNILAIHFRLLRQGELTNDFQGIASLLDGKIPDAIIEQTDAIYVAYGPGEEVAVRDGNLLEGLSQAFPRAKVVTCKNMPNCPIQQSKALLEPAQLTRWAEALQEDDPDTFAKLFRSNYAAAILDLWMCVQSDFFIGRELSTFSKNVGFWREALEEVNRPLPFSFYQNVA